MTQNSHIHVPLDDRQNYFYSHDIGLVAYLLCLDFELVGNKAKTEALTSVRAQWLNTVNNVRTIIQQSEEYIYIPDLRPEALISKP